MYFLCFLRYFGCTELSNSILRHFQSNLAKNHDENVIKLLTRIRLAKKSVFYFFYGILGAPNYQIRYLGIFNQIGQKIMTAVSRFVSDGPHKDMSRKRYSIFVTHKISQKKTFFMLFMVF